MQGYWLVAIVAAAAAAVGFVLGRRARPTLAPAPPRTNRDERIIRLMAESTPTAFVLFTDEGRIVYTNDAARELFFEGKSFEGSNFLSLLQNAPEPLRRALLAERDEIFSVETDDSERETYHLSKRHLDLDGERHTLLMVRHLTHELNRQEVEVWKRLIRVIAHEVNNSLAPISSLVHSARLLAQQPEPAQKLNRVFDTVAERADHLRDFLDGYARFARLPLPRKDSVAWPQFLDQIRGLYPKAKIEDAGIAEPGFFDAGQMQQVLINLLKNAEEAGGDVTEVSLAVESLPDRSVRLVVRDRGKGMSSEVMRNALLPFYTTKERGSGLGLPLCREIVEAHGGRLRIRSREGGGTEVSCHVPGKNADGESVRARLTLTRG